MWKTGYQTAFVTIITFVSMVKFDAMVTLGIPARGKNLILPSINSKCGGFQ
jgi:hypothetical protein